MITSQDEFKTLNNVTALSIFWLEYEEQILEEDIFPYLEDTFLLLDPD